MIELYSRESVPRWPIFSAWRRAEVCYATDALPPNLIESLTRVDADDDGPPAPERNSRSCR